MIHPAADLQKSIYTALVNNSALVTVLGGVKIHDHHPEKEAFPYVVLGRATSTDWSTSTESGASHLITVHTWSRNSGRMESYAVQQEITSALHDMPLTAQDHHIVNLRLEFSEARYDPDSGRMHGIMRFSAITEPKI